jgi:hypothetical protein
MTEIKVHPAAECVRLMDPEELASLAASIEAHGQRDAIIMGRVNGAEVELLVDGRNRLRACEIAKVEPHFEVMQFDDDEAVKAFVADKSEHRNLTKAQQAMRIALLYPVDGGKGGRGKKDAARNLPENGSFGRERLRQARIVLAFSREYALAVRDGTRKLDDVLRDIEKEQRALQSDEIKHATLQKEAPDLADLVTEDRLALAEATAALEKRRAQEREQREATLRVMTNAADAVSAFGSQTFCDAVEAIIADPVLRAEFAKRLGGNIDREKLERGCTKLTQYLAELES